LLGAAFAASLCAHENYLLPEDKPPIVIDPSERTPFAFRGSVLETKFVEEDAESEECKLRARREKMKVTGFYIL